MIKKISIKYFCSRKNVCFVIEGKREREREREKEKERERERERKREKERGNCVSKNIIIR